MEEASDGAEAREKLKTASYGLVISDWNMESMSGYELLCHVRTDDGLKHTPFIMITAETKTENGIAAKKAGVSNSISRSLRNLSLSQQGLSSRPMDLTRRRLRVRLSPNWMQSRKPTLRPRLPLLN